MLLNSSAINQFFKPENLNPERIETYQKTLSGSLSLLALLLVCVALSFLIPKLFSFFQAQTKKELILKLLFSISILLNLVVRLVTDHTYNTPLIFISYLADILILLYAFHFIGGFLPFIKTTLSFPERFLNGLTTLVIIGITVNAILPTLLGQSIFPSTIVFSLLSCFTIYKIWKDKEVIIFSGLRLEQLLFLSFFTAPIFFYFAQATVPESDIQSVIDIAGLLTQGKNLFHAPSGILSEVFRIRYPSGYVYFTYIASLFLNILNPESVILLMIISFATFLNANYKIIKKLNLPIIIYSVFLFSYNLYHFDGIPGGQTLKLFAFTIGLYIIHRFLNKDQGPFVIALLSLQIITQPLIAIPFVITTAVYYLSYRKTTFMTWTKKEWGYCFLYIGFTSIYILSLLHDNTVDNKVAFTISKLTLGGFFTYIHRYGMENYKQYYFSVFSIFLIGYSILKDKLHLTVLITWLLGAFFIDGFFGWGNQGWQRFYAYFSLTSLVPIGMCFIFIFIKRKTNIKIAYLIFIPLMLLWPKGKIGSYLIMPVKPFMTHEDMRLCKKIVNTDFPKTNLVANLAYPRAHKFYGWPFRGCSGLNSIYSRTLEHHLKDTPKAKEKYQGVILPNCLSGYLKCYMENECNQSKEFYATEMKSCLLDNKITHVFLSSKNTEVDYLKEWGSPMLQSAGAKLYDLSKIK